MSRALLVACLALASCDWDYFALINSVPAGENARHPRIDVLLGLDGVAETAMRQALAEGAFAGDQWHLAALATAFPGTSDYAWTRLMHTEPLEGYEFAYYDAAADQIAREGYTGVAAHAVPWLMHPCFRAFDYAGNGPTGLYYMYREPWLSLENALDATFVLLRARLGTDTPTALFSYLNETDALGHLQGEAATVRALHEISDRIRRFRQAHPTSNVVFTIASDHGQNFVPCEDMASCLLSFDAILPSLGVRVLQRLADAAPTEPAAVPVVHVRVNYLALHTHATAAPEVARRVTVAPAVDLAVARIPAPPEWPEQQALQWFGAWTGGALRLRFAHAADTDTYFVEGASDFAALGLPWADADTGLLSKSDEELFAATAAGPLPDFFYRVRTALAPVGVATPASVLLTFAPPFASLGIGMPAEDSDLRANSSFHGSLRQPDTFGVVLTEARTLPPIVRVDTLLELLPNLRTGLAERSAYRGRNDPNEGLDYERVVVSPR